MLASLTASTSTGEEKAAEIQATYTGQYVDRSSKLYARWEANTHCVVPAEPTSGCCSVGFLRDGHELRRGAERAEQPVLTMSELTHDGSAVSKKTSYYLPQLDGLRLVAFLLVFFVHSPMPVLSGPASPGSAIATAYSQVSQALGNFGVDLFFCLSAFLITRLLLLEFDRYGNYSITRFLIRRVLRIWPLYYLILVLGMFILPILIVDTSVVQPLDSDAQTAILRRTLLPHILFFANNQALIVGSPGPFLAHMWSISLEEQFYLIWPFALFYLLANRSSTKTIVAVLIAVLAFTTAAKLYFIIARLPHPYIWLNSITRLDAFATGAIVALKDRWRPGFVPLRHAQPVVGAALVALILLLPSPFLPEPTFFIPLDYLFCAVGFALIIDYVVGMRSALSRVLALAPIVFLGRISYGLYVFHILALYLVRTTSESLGMHPFDNARWLVFISASFGLTVLMAAASYYLFEARFLSLKDRFARVVKANEATSKATADVLREGGAEELTPQLHS